jgi:hypothetical protein
MYLLFLAGDFGLCMGSMARSFVLAYVCICDVAVRRYGNGRESRFRGDVLSRGRQEVCVLTP